ETALPEESAAGPVCSTAPGRGVRREREGGERSGRRRARAFPHRLAVWLDLRRDLLRVAHDDDGHVLSAQVLAGEGLHLARRGGVDAVDEGLGERLGEALQVEERELVEDAAGGGEAEQV